MPNKTSPPLFFFFRIFSAIFAFKKYINSRISLSGPSRNPLVLLSGQYGWDLWNNPRRPGISGGGGVLSRTWCALPLLTPLLCCPLLSRNSVFSLVIVFFKFSPLGFLLCLDLFQDISAFLLLLQRWLFLPFCPENGG